MASDLWDRKGVLLVDFMPPGSTISAAAYCDALTRLRRVIKNIRRGMLSRGLCLIHDNPWPHSASGKIQVGYIGPSAVQSGLRAHRFPLVSSPKETSRLDKVRRRR